MSRGFACCGSIQLFKPADRSHPVRSVVHETSSRWATVVDQMRNRFSGRLQVIKIDKWAGKCVMSS